MSPSILTVVFSPHDADELAELADRFEAEVGEVL